MSSTFNISILQHFTLLFLDFNSSHSSNSSSFQILQHLNSSIFQFFSKSFKIWHFISSILQLSTTSILQHFNSSKLQSFKTSILQHFYFSTSQFNNISILQQFNCQAKVQVQVQSQVKFKVQKVKDLDFPYSMVISPPHLITACATPNNRLCHHPP